MKVRYFSKNIALSALCIAMLCPLTASGQEPEAFEEALQKYNSKAYDAAYVHLKASLNTEPDHLPSKLLMGKVLMLKGLLPDSLLEFEEALEMGADRNIVAPDLLQLYILSGDYQAVLDFDSDTLNSDTQAIAYLFKANAYDSLELKREAEAAFRKALSFKQEARLLNSYASFLLRGDRVPEAAALIDQALAVDSNDARTLQLRGVLASKQGREDEALKWYELASEKSKSDPIIQRSLAFTYLKLGKLDKAEEVIDLVLQQAPNDPTILLLKSGLLREKGDSEVADEMIEELSNTLTLMDDFSDKDSGFIHLTKGTTYFFAKLYEASAQEFERYLNVAPPDKNTLLLLAQSYKQIDDNRRFAETLERFPKITRSSSELVSLACRRYIEEERFVFCETLLENVDESIKHHDLVLFSHVSLHQARGNYAAAIKLLKEQYKPPYSTQVLVHLTRLHYMAGNNDKALDFAELLLVSNPSNPDFLRLKAEILIAEKRWTAAENVAAKLETVVNSEYFVNYVKAKILINQQKYAEAKLLLEAIDTTNTIDLDITVLKARLSSFLGENSEAVELLTQYRKTHGASKTVNETLVMVYSNMGAFEDALAEIENLRRNQITNPKYIEGKINLLIKLERVKLAKLEIARLEQLLPATAENTLQLISFRKQIQDYEGALRIIELLAARETLSTRILLEKATLLLEINKPEAARETVDLVLSDESSATAPAYFIAGKIAQAQNKPSVAYSHFRQGFIRSEGALVYALSMNNTITTDAESEDFVALLEEVISKNSIEHLSLTYVLAQHHFYQDRWEVAKPLLEAYIKQNHTRYKHNAMTLLALIVIDDEKEKGMQLAQEAYSLAPRSALVLSTYGWAHAKNNNYDQALYYLRQAHAIESADSDTLFRLGVVLGKLARPAEARRFLKQALTSYGDNNEGRVQEVQQLLSEMKES
ncbi:tetratricopeptide repeat protein [Alteromonas sp. ASW11-19]|uniref:Tetratricopeptide repeat protein n=1 Tax=Alteromonas salexigens TaxID=2982530 RepID=A0ABT2VR37_9ALTE|nr:tetratricopeptide repeat protein [Alteromonas salexigens]MCU7555785.1 tetratricopeptide repeat protein [Alteromonas salexigens]